MTRNAFEKKMDLIANALEKLIADLPKELSEKVIMGEIGDSDSVFEQLGALKKQISKNL